MSVVSQEEDGAPAPAAAADRVGPGPDDDIWTHDLRKVYGDKIVAVDALDLTVRRGEIFGLLGPNGAGKTTTVGMLTTRIVPTAGRAVVNDVDVAADPARARQAIGVVSQGNTLDRRLSARDNLILHGRYFGMSARAARAAADQWLEAFQLSHRAKAEVEELSGGMARRLMLARAMLHGPAVLFLDEPTAGLDPQSRAALWDYIGELHEGGRTVLLTTHYIEEAERFCDRVAIMDHGEILALDTPMGLKGSLGAGVSITLRTEGDAERLARRLRALAGASVSVAADGRIRLHVAGEDSAMVKVIGAAQKGGFRLTEIAQTEDNLESVFITMTGRGLRE
ncbi:MAG TPA: ATP-binding cassette domain-containing protein [Candidatus Dormibacteraeota bacterium]